MSKVQEMAKLVQLHMRNNSLEASPFEHTFSFVNPSQADEQGLREQHSLPTISDQYSDVV